MKESLPNTSLSSKCEGAEEAAHEEHNMSFWEAVKHYPNAVIFSLILSFAIIMEGYDTALLGSFFSLPQFRRRFGTKHTDNDFQISSSW